MKYIICTALLLSGCGMYQLMPEADRSVSYKIQTHLPRGKAHSKINEWVAKTFVDANTVIKMNDKEEGKLIVKGRGLCDVVNPVAAAIGAAAYMGFTLISTASDNSVEIQFIDVMGVGPDGEPGYFPTNKKDMDSITTTCLNRYSTEIESALK